jgi:hypothetical protein
MGKKVRGLFLFGLHEAPRSELAAFHEIEAVEKRVQHEQVNCRFAEQALGGLALGVP